jgi:hypothetical protein
MNAQTPSQIGPDGSAKSDAHPAAHHNAAASQSGSSSFLSCDNSTFWAISSTGVVQRFQIVGSSAILIDSISVNSGYGSLAFCNNQNGSTPSPTLYAADPSGDLIYYSNGTWVTTGGSAAPLPDGGGSGNHLYFIDGNNGSGVNVVQYQNSSSSILFTIAGNLEAASIAVDDSGNVWYIGNSTGAYLEGDYIGVVSPTGQVLKQYNIPEFYTENAYGSMSLNNIYYLGLGPTSPGFPNRLFAFTFTADSAIQLPSISMPNYSFSDLASCSAGAPLSNYATGIHTIADGQIGSFSIYPNPTMDKCTISVNQGLLGARAVVSDISGTEISVFQLLGPETTYNTAPLSDGIYFVTIESSNGSKMVRKLVVNK